MRYIRKEGIIKSHINNHKSLYLIITLIFTIQVRIRLSFRNSPQMLNMSRSKQLRMVTGVSTGITVTSLRRTLMANG